MITTVITVVLVLGFLIFVHELGHYLAARAVGVRVIEFSIGFPPKLVSTVRGGTEYMLSLIPIGGYVRLKGQNIDDEDEQEPGNYAAKSISQRLLILIAGPFMNLMIALLFMPIVFMVGYEIPAYLLKPPVIEDVIVGSEADKLDIRPNDRIMSINDRPVGSWREVQMTLANLNAPMISLQLQRDVDTIQRHINSSLFQQHPDFGWVIHIDPIVGRVASGSPAADVGLVAGDRILEIDGQTVDSWAKISPAVQGKTGAPLQITFERDGRIQMVTVQPEWREDHGQWIIGISSGMTRVSENVGDAIRMGVQRVGFLTASTLEFLYRLMVREVGTDGVGGPIMIAQLLGQAARTNIGNLLSLVAFISLQFAIFNLLPIPALDGGHLFFLGLEKIKGRSLSKKFRLTTQKIGFTLLMLLIVYISIQDGLRIFQN
jgi:regulator of sigma E protease